MLLLSKPFDALGDFKLKRIFSLLLILVVCIACFGAFCVMAHAESATAFDLVLSAPETVNLGDSFSVYVNVRNITAEHGICAVQFALYYDSELVSLDKASFDGGIVSSPVYVDNGVTLNRYEGILFDGGDGKAILYFVDRPEYNTKEFLCDGVQGVKSDDVLCFSVPFVVNNNASNGTRLDFEIKSDKTETVGTDPGDWDGLSFDREGKPAYSVSPFGVSARGSSVSVTVGGMKGDVNGDGWIDALDAAAILQYDVGIKDLDYSLLLAADVDGDGYVDSMDAAKILQYDAGIIESLG